mmetsp:Transcript_7082/g.14476  ORF Transcript_7082/g.14476 Transcript_7082/m.14476 type:complete len:207 (-) Transcript_7082:57-677(-)
MPSWISAATRTCDATSERFRKRATRVILAGITAAIATAAVKSCGSPKTGLASEATRKSCGCWNGDDGSSSSSTSTNNPSSRRRPARSRSTRSTAPATGARTAWQTSIATAAARAITATAATCTTARRKEPKRPVSEMRILPSSKMTTPTTIRRASRRSTPRAATCILPTIGTDPRGGEQCSVCGQNAHRSSIRSFGRVCLAVATNK